MASFFRLWYTQYKLRQVTEGVVFLKELILGIVQGATEFLPISSSGHLGLFSKVMSMPPNLSFFAFLHLATFLAVLVMLWSDVWSILTGLFRLQKESWLLAAKIVVSTVPAGLVGVLFEKKVEEALNSQKLIGVFFLVTAVVLLVSDRFVGKKTLNDLSFLDALVVGLFQALAILPGLSRSGLTLFGALLVGLSRTDAFRYSFLLSLPVTLGAGLLELDEIALNAGVMAGFAGALVSGLASLFLLRLLTVSAHLKYFSLYLLLPALLSFLVR